MTTSFEYSVALAASGDDVLVAEADGLAAPIGRDLTLDVSTGELALSKGDLTLVTEYNAIRQELIQRLQFFQNDWFLDVTAGLPYFEQILNKRQADGIITGLYRAEIEACPGVKSVKSLEVSVNKATRQMGINFTVDTDLGELSISNFLNLDNRVN